jgi:type I restriction enzyme M protein
VTSNAIVQKLWNYCNILRDDGLSYQDYIEQLTFQLFLKMAEERQKPFKERAALIPRDLIGRETWITLGVDVKGDAYEGLLEKNAADVKGGVGQYFTPRALIQAVVDVMLPGPGQLIHDPL